MALALATGTGEGEGAGKGEKMTTRSFRERKARNPQAGIRNRRQGIEGMAERMWPARLSRGVATAVAWCMTALLVTPAPAVAVEAVSAQPGDALQSSWQWRRTSAPGGVGSEGLTAVAALSDGAGGAWVAVGGAQGVAVRAPGHPFRFAARVALVTDLHFDSAGGLWITSLKGLWHLSSDGRLEDRSPGPGEVARRVRRLALACMPQHGTDFRRGAQRPGDECGSGAGTMALATDAGAYVSRDGHSWQRLGNGLPSGSVSSVALRVAPESGDGSSLEVWAVVGARLWRAVIAVEDGEVRTLGARAESIAGSPAGVEPVDVVVELPGADVALLYPRTLALLGAPPAQGAGAVERRWEVVRPVLPPGAAARRLAAAGGRLWLSTDRGLLEADSLAGSWRRSGLPAGSAPSWSLVAGGREELLVASRTGLLTGSPPEPGTLGISAADPAPAVARRSSEPDILEVQRAALRHVGLRPERVRELRRGVARRGWLPSVSLRLGGALDRDFNRDYDDAVVYGDRYYLRDEERDSGRQLDASIVFVWDFPDLIFNPDSIDLSREVRQVIAMRDDVLDEINQLYFERENVLLRLSTWPPAASAPESEGPAAGRLAQLQLQLRAEELTAGIDAWTGGWFSAHIRRASPQFQVPSTQLSPR